MVDMMVASTREKMKITASESMQMKRGRRRERKKAKEEEKIPSSVRHPLAKNGVLLVNNARRR